MNTVQRTISLAVNTCLSHEWKDFMALLHNAWKQSTCLANWASQTLARHDAVRLPNMTELPPWEAIDLYALAFGRDRERPSRKAGRPPLPVVRGQIGDEDWQGAKVAASTLLRKVQSKYLRERGKVIWRRERRTPEFRYPYPFPLHPQAWSSRIGEQKELLVDLALPSSRVVLKLRGGSEFHRQVGVFKRIASGELKRQEATLCGQMSFGRNGRLAAERKPTGGHRSSLRVMMRMAYLLEVKEREAEGSATLRTGADPFLTLVARDDSPPWLLHAPWVRSWIVEHRRFLDAFADDLKYEKRWPASKRQALNRYRERRCEKHHRRVKTFLQQTAAQVAGYLVRHKVAALTYDDSSRDFVNEFPWFEFAGQLANKCEENGIAFVPSASGEDMDESSRTARGDESD